MPTHDIIDNRNEKLVDHINRVLSSTEAARKEGKPIPPPRYRPLIYPVSR